MTPKTKPARTLLTLPIATAVLLATATACGNGGTEPAVSTEEPSRTQGSVAVPSPRTRTSATASSHATPADTPGATSTTPRAEFDVGRVLADVRAIAALGPREATSSTHRKAAGLVERRLVSLGFRVRRQAFNVPAGTLDSVRVPAGRSENVIAEPAGFDPSRPFAVVGAHLDTEPRSPGGNDNASGVAALLELARLASASRPQVPVVFVVFGGEEPRRPNGNRWGSKAYVAAMPKQQRPQVVGMLNLDSIGVGAAVPVCVGGGVARDLQRSVLAAARRAGILAKACTTRASDHQSFELVGMPAVLLGGVDYPQYHQPSDRAGVVQAGPVSRATRLAWEILR